MKQGQQVDATILLGQVGWTGKTSFGPHTHFEIRKGGKRRIDGFFQYQRHAPVHLCSVTGGPVTAQGVTNGQQTDYTSSRDHQQGNSYRTLPHCRQNNSPCWCRFWFTVC